MKGYSKYFLRSGMRLLRYILDVHHYALPLFRDIFFFIIHDYVMLCKQLKIIAYITFKV